MRWVLLKQFFHLSRRSHLIPRAKHERSITILHRRRYQLRQRKVGHGLGGGKISTRSPSTTSGYNGRVDKRWWLVSWQTRREWHRKWMMRATAAAVIDERKLKLRSRRREGGGGWWWGGWGWHAASDELIFRPHRRINCTDTSL